MNDAPKRRLLDQLGGSPTFVADGCRIAGDLETPGPLVVCGSIKGDGLVGGMLNMAVQAEWRGQIRAQRAVIAGKVFGTLSVEDRLEIGSTAIVHARVSARTIAIAKGAVIEGEVTVTSGQGVVSFQDRRDSK